MNEQQIKINKLAKTFGSALISSGFSIVKSGYSNLVPVIKSYSFLHDSLVKIKNVPITERDVSYYLTTKENWDEMFDLIYGIVKNFKWQAEKFDCDDRAKLVSALCAILFGLNSCGECYCQVTSLSESGFTGNHYNNIVVTQNGEVILFDVDQQGLRKVLRPNEPISFGVWSYSLLSYRF